MDVLKVVVVDGNPQLGDRIGAFLEKCGATATVFSEVSRADNALAAIQPDAVIVDADLENEGAREVLGAARQARSNPLNVVLVSARTDQGFLIGLDFDLRLSKPFKGKALRDLVERLSSKRREPKLMRPRPRQSLKTMMANAGQLATTPFAALLYKLFANRSTGVLSIFGEMGERMLFLLDGAPVYAASNAAKDSIGAVLVKLGFLEMEDLNNALESRRQGQALASVLLERGLLSAEKLLEAMERQTYERTIGCFAFSQGTYVFEQNTEVLDNVRHFPQNPIALIVDGVDRFVGPNRLASWLRPSLGKYVVRTEKYGAFERHFPMTQWRGGVMDKIRGQTTLQQLTTGHSDEMMNLLRLVWSLKVADMVDFLDEPRSSAERSPDKPPIPSKAPTLVNIDRAVLDRALAEARSNRDEMEIPTEVDREELARLTRVVLDYTMRLGRADHWALLGVKRGCSSEEAAAALTQSLERLPGPEEGRLPEHVTRQAMEVQTALKAAFETITNAEASKRYSALFDEGARHSANLIKSRRKRSLRSFEPVEKAEEVLEAWVKPPASSRVSAPEWRLKTPPTAEDPDGEASRSRASMLLRDARKAMSRKDFPAACRILKGLIGGAERSSEVMVLMAWCVFNLPHHDRTQKYRVCRSRIEVELTLTGAEPESYYLLGRMAEDFGDVKEAFKQYSAALAIDRGYASAQARWRRLKKHKAIVATQTEGGDFDSFADIFDRMS